MLVSGNMFDLVGDIERAIYVALTYAVGEELNILIAHEGRLRGVTREMISQAGARVRTSRSPPCKIRFHLGELPEDHRYTPESIVAVYCIDEDLLVIHLSRVVESVQE